MRVGLVTRRVRHMITSGGPRAAYPEYAAGGYSRVDGSVEFYTRVRALLCQDMRVVDYGAGRAALTLRAIPIVRDLRTLKGSVAEVIGVDIDPEVLGNPTVDRAIVLDESGRIPLPDGSVGLVLSDFTFEHVQDPGLVGAELDRILQPGGWVCARTPNRWGIIGLGARAVPNRLHVAALRRLQPAKEGRDTFPTAYRMNTQRQLRRAFPPDRFEHFTYTYQGQPTYAGRSVAAVRLFQAVGAVTPAPLRPMLMVFLRKRQV